MIGGVFCGIEWWDVFFEYRKDGVWFVFVVIGCSCIVCVDVVDIIGRKFGYF